MHTESTWAALKSIDAWDPTITKMLTSLKYSLGFGIFFFKASQVIQKPT